MTYGRYVSLYNQCPVWPGFPIEHIPPRPSPDAIDYVVGSARAGGDYYVDADTRHLLSGEDKRINDRVRASLTTMLVDMRSSGVEAPVVTPELINQAVHASPMAVHTRADRLLLFIGRRCNTIDEVFSMGNKDPEYGAYTVASEFPNRYGALAWTESSTDNELTYVWNYIRDEMKWIAAASVINTSRHEDCVITPAGHARIAELSTRTDSAQAFIARWFEKSMDDICDKAIAPAIMAAGYVPYRIEEADSLDPITDQIIAEIRRSRFLVADFTHGCDGARGSVYYEAGFAHGLNIPVIFTAREGTKPHFDTSTYPHICWKPDELPAFQDALTNRILALKELGPGPRLP